MREVGLPGPMDPAPIPVGRGPEQAPETAPLLTILIAVLEAATSLKHVKNAIAVVSLLCLAFLQQFMAVHFAVVSGVLDILIIA